MAKVLVYLWFDVEDYITPEADEPPKRIVEILSKHNVKATAKLVGQKVRSLQKRKREDVIEALSTLDIGYHLDTHSRHPTLYEYLADKDIETGAAEFQRREEEGAAYVSHAFNRDLSCLGHPGWTWAPHVYPAMPKMRIPVYLDETSILNLNDSPYWYCNVLNLNGAGRNFINLDFFFNDPKGLQKVKRQFNQIYGRLRTKGGAISILFHVHTIVNRRFWDEVNFARGRNPAVDELVVPPRQPPEVTERAYRDFEELIKYILSFDDVDFITARDAMSIFQDPSRSLEVDRERLDMLARKSLREIRHQKIDRAYLSPAQIFCLVTKAVACYAQTNVIPDKLPVVQPLGPPSRKRTRGPRTLSMRSLLQASRIVLDTMERTGYIPSGIVVERSVLIPEDYLSTASSVLLRILHGRKLPEKVVLRRGKLAQSRYVNSQAFAKACKWQMLPENFKAPGILEQTLLQAWTLKPALPLDT